MDMVGAVAPQRQNIAYLIGTLEGLVSYHLESSSIRPPWVLKTEKGTMAFFKTWKELSIRPDNGGHAGNEILYSHLLVVHEDLQMVDFTLDLSYAARSFNLAATKFSTSSVCSW